MQIHPNNQKDFPNVKIRKILEDKSVIGLGEWEKGKDQQLEQFKNKMGVEDIVAVRNGHTPIALVEITGEYEHIESVDEGLDWFPNRRKVKILTFYNNEKDNFTIPMAQGTLSICSDYERETSKAILKWHKKFLTEKYPPLLKVCPEDSA